MSDRKRREKPPKPRPTFPLFAHANGQWAKKVRGRLHYFGPWADPDAAEAAYLESAADLRAGRTRRVDPAAVTVADAVNRFLAAKEAAHEAGELAFKSWRDYLATGRRVVQAFGRLRPVSDLAADDFAGLRKQLAARRGPVALGTEIQRTRTLFKFAYDDGLIDRPVRFGVGFKRPKPRAVRRARREAGPRMFEPAEVRNLLTGAAEPLRTMILLGVNGGFGPADCASLPVAAVDLNAATGPVIDFPRPKTEVPRRVPLWSETADGLRRCLPLRPAPRDPADGGLAFLTRRGNPWVRGNTDAVNLQFRKLRERLGVGRPGLGFYALRHTFRTLADESRDLVAVDAVMGHADHTMGGHYRERIGDDRLRAVTDAVRAAVLTDEGDGAAAAD